jgi:hypothetical protein
VASDIRAGRALSVLFAAFALLLLVAGCGGSSHASGTGKPLSGAFADIRQYPSSHTFGPQHVKGGVTIRSFGVDHATPRQIVQWYAAHLSGWTVVTPPTRRGRSDEFAKWSRAGRWLQISSAPAPAAGGSQYSLIVASSAAALP